MGTHSSEVRFSTGLCWFLLLLSSKKSQVSVSNGKKEEENRMNGLYVWNVLSLSLSVALPIFHGDRLA